MLNKEDENLPQKQFLSVQEAAEYLGVHAGTVRRWAYAKRIKGSKIGIRGDWRFTKSDLLEIAHENSSFEVPDTVSPITDWSKIGDNAHFVQFYEDDLFLVKAIKEFIISGDTAIVVAAPIHKEKLEEGLEMYGLDLATARDQGLYVGLDAAEMLSKFMKDGLPDPNLFFETIGGLITRVSRNKKHLRIFGEMVALLWAEGNQDGAIMLEELWNELQKIHSFTLFCAYPIHGFGNKSHAMPFEKIENMHSHVIPSESYSSLTESQKFREIALLQQKALALKAEIEEHKKTEMKLLETVIALQSSEEFNRKIIENSADCIKVLDLEGNLLAMNQPGCKIFEIENIEDYLGKSYCNFWDTRYHDDLNSAFDTAKKGEIGRFQGYCPTAKGTPKWWDVVITPMYDKNGNADKLLAISRDITSIKELDQRKEDFLSVTSHELKTPLTSQKVFIQLLKAQIEKNKEEKYVRYVSKINAQTDKLMRLVTDLLDVSKVQAGKLVLNPVPFDINTLIKDCVEEIQLTTESHTISITGNVSRQVYGDNEKISQVIINLLTNAIKYSPHAKKVEVSLKTKRGFALIAVQDFGIGIDKKHTERIFDRFYRVSDEDGKTYPGLGMGLYLSSEIIKQHGGKIWFKSNKGKGSTFYFTVPFT